MESRNITTELETLGESIENAQVEEKIKNELREKLEKIKDVYDNELQCPISYEYFSSSNAPYTIVTDPAGTKKTVIDADTKNDYESQNTKTDPISRHTIIGYEINQEKTASFKEQEHQLDLLHNELKQEIANAAKVKSEKSNLSKSSFSQFAQSQSNVVEDPNNIILYKSSNGELAVKFPNVELMNACIKILGTGKYKNSDYPKPHPTFPIIYFPGYTSTSGEFTGIFPTKAMRDQFFSLLIRDKNQQEPSTGAFTRTNKAKEQVIHFLDKSFHDKQGNVVIPIPNALKADMSMSRSKKF